MNGEIKINKFEEYADMNLDELKANAEALNTPATAFDILTLHKAIKDLSITIDNINKTLEIEITNGSKKKVRISDLVLEIYETQRSYRLRRAIISELKQRKKSVLFIILIFGFLLGSLFGIKFDFDIIKLFF